MTILSISVVSACKSKMSTDFNSASHDHFKSFDEPPTIEAMMAMNLNIFG